MMNSRIQTLLGEYRGILSQGTNDPQTTATELDRIQPLVTRVVNHVWPLVESYNNSTSTCNVSTLSPAAASYVGVIAYPLRFLHRVRLTPDRYEEVRTQLLTCFVYGLLTHLSLKTFPTRDRIERVDIEILWKDYFPKSLLPRRLLSTYDHDCNSLPSAIFDYYFRTCVEPLLRNGLGLSWWKLVRSRSYFLDLFFAGVLLGPMYDLKTRGPEQSIGGA